MMDSPKVVFCKVRFAVRILTTYGSAGKLPRDRRLSFTANAAKTEASTVF